MNNTIILVLYYIMWWTGMYRRIEHLRDVNPDMKALISIGGWNEGSDKYSKMASSADSRKKFVNSVVKFIQTYKFDGLDVDWYAIHCSKQHTYSITHPFPACDFIGSTRALRPSKMPTEPPVILRIRRTSSHCYVSSGMPSNRITIYCQRL